MSSRRASTTPPSLATLEASPPTGAEERSSTCAFDLEPASASRGTFTMTLREMTLMRELMREVGAISDMTTVRVTSGPRAHPLAAPIAKFLGARGQLVTATECAVIAARLRDHRDLVHDVASFFVSDPPAGAMLDAWLAKWIDFNERAVHAGGYRAR